MFEYNELQNYLTDFDNTIVNECDLIQLKIKA